MHRPSYFHRVSGTSFSPQQPFLLRTFSIALLAAAGLAGVFAGPQLLSWIVSRLHAALDTSFWSEGFIASGWWLLTFAASLVLVRSSVHSPIYRWVNPLLLLLWFGYFLIIQFRHPILLPFFDDYTGFLDDYSLILSGNYPLTRIEWLWQTYWECRVPIPRLLFILLSACFGNQVFLAAKLLTTLLLALVGYLLLLHTEARKKPVTSLLILGGLLHFGFFFSSLSGLSGTCYYGSLLGSLWALHLQHRNRSIGLVLLAATLGALCFASGFVVFPVLLYRAWKAGAKRSLRWIAAWTALFCALYFYGYHPQRLNALDGFFPIAFLAFIPIFLGNSLQFLYHWSLPLLGGSVLTWIGVQHLRVKNAGYYADVLLVLIGIAAMTAFFRHPAGVEWALNIRYGVFSSVALLAAIMLVSKSESALQKWLLPLLLVGLLRTFFFYPEMALTQEKNLNMIRAWQNGRTDRPSQPFFPDNTEMVLTQSRDANLWQLPQNPPKGD